MELPVQTNTQSKTRSAADVRAMGQAVQANLVQLKVADARRRGISVEAHEIKVPAPGTVSRFREALISVEQLRAYRPDHIRLRLHEVWGQYCLMRWVLHVDAGDNSYSFGAGATVAMLAEDGHDLRCDAHLNVKHDEVHALLWRMRYEQRIRFDATYAEAAEFKRDQLLAAQIPAVVMGKTVTQCDNDELLAVSCEHAGMLGAIRWIMDRNRLWGEDGIMEVADQPW